MTTSTQHFTFEFDPTTGRLEILEGASRAADLAEPVRAALTSALGSTGESGGEGAPLTLHVALLAAGRPAREKFLARLRQVLPEWSASGAPSKSFRRAGQYQATLRRTTAETAEAGGEVDAEAPDRSKPSATIPTVGGGAGDTIHAAGGRADKRDLVAEAGRLADAYAAAVAHLDPQFDAWLASLEGLKFLVEEADEQVAAIERLTRQAGRQLLYEGEPVTLYVNKPPKAKHARVYVTTITRRPQLRLHDALELPRLSSRRSE